MVPCLRRFERDTAVDAVDLESRNKFCRDLLLQQAVRSLVLQTVIVSLCLDLVLVHPHYPRSSSSWKWIASCSNNLVWALKVYYRCIHAYTCCQEQLALDLLLTKTVEEWYEAFTQLKSKLCTDISFLLILSNLLMGGRLPAVAGMPANRTFLQLSAGQYDWPEKIAWFCYQKSAGDLFHFPTKKSDFP